ncbi:MAG: hypothetical protein ACOCRO_00880 [Halanaerobiales bacterium]
MDKLVKLPRFSYTQLDYDTIISDVRRSIEEHPEYLENWDDFLDTNAGKMLLELNAYISEKVAAKADWYAREMFVSTATRKSSLINILKLINYRPSFPRTARVSVNLKLTKWASSFRLPHLETLDVPDKNGQLVPFECIDMADDNKPDYEYRFHADTGTESNKIYNIEGIPFYQGKTKTESDIFMDGVNNERFSLSNKSIIENTVRVKSLTTGKELIEVDSFISPEAQQNDVDPSLRTIPYRVEVNSDNTVDIVFGHEDLVDIPKRGERIEVKYRIGGGFNTNIVSGSINSTKTYKLDGDRITVIFSNPASAIGGSDNENIEEAKLTAPLKLRTANKTVTNEDYLITLENHPNILHSQIISKENEPSEIFEEYEHFLPPLDTWIYICPEREGLEETDPVNYEKKFKLSKSYVEHDIIDYEDIDLYPSKQTVLLKKYRKNAWAKMYITVYDENFTEDWLASDSFVEGRDYSLNEVTAELTRIQSVDDGTIPAPDNDADPLTLRILYVDTESLEEFKQKTVKDFTDNDSNKYIARLTENPNILLYPNKKIKVWDKKMEKKYEKDVDYTVNYELGRLELTDDTNIDSDEKVLVYYADNWDTEKINEEKMYLDFIKNKKMLCVDNHIKDARYSTYDVAVTIYTYKNMTNDVKNNIEEHIRDRYNINKQTFGEDISKSEIASHIMTYPGVRLAEITYLGKNYNLYQNYLLDNITQEELREVESENVEYRINAKYNEILTLSNDEWNGTEILENQKHGLIITFKEV